jgi:hypothetical protein
MTSTQQTSEDRQNLIELNKKINRAENKGDAKALAGFMASHLAFQRANPTRTIDDLGLFLQKAPGSASPPPDNRQIKVGTIDLYEDRAVVTCIVTKGKQRFHNLRLFIKVKEVIKGKEEENWKLLGWANKEITDPQVTSIEEYEVYRKSHS